MHHRIASRDGQAVHLEEMIAALRALGHEVVLVGPPGLLQTGFGGSSAAVDRVKAIIPGWLYEVLELGYNAKAFVRLWRAVRAHRPEVIYERFSLFLFAGVWVRRLTGLPLLLEVNSPLFEERAGNDGLRLHRVGRWAQRMIWNGADHVLPVTGVLGRVVAAYGVPAGRITVIANGIDPQRFGAVMDSAAAKAALGLGGRTVLGFTGFIRGWNGLDRVVDFLAVHGAALNLHFLVAGDGPARGPLLARAQAAGVAERVTISGILGRDDVGRHVAAFDVALIPGLTPYSSPLKLFEYLQLGRAIVAPDTENIREILRDGENAVLFAPDTEGAMEDALLTVCADGEMRGRLGVAARAVIAAKSLTWASNARRVVAIARELAAR